MSCGNKPENVYGKLRDGQVTHISGDDPYIGVLARHGGPTHIYSIATSGKAFYTC